VSSIKQARAFLYRYPVCTFVSIQQPDTSEGEGNMLRNPLRVDGFHATIGSAYHAVEGYLERLASLSGAGDAASPLSVSPIDALLIHLLALYQPARPYVVDLAAASTWGVSTLLCRTDPSVRQVVTSCENPGEKWQTILGHYLRDWTVPLVECVTVEGTRDALAKVSDSVAPTLVIAVSKDATTEQSSTAFEIWLELAPQAVLVLLGVEKTGDSSALAFLTARCTRSTYRLALPRELAPALTQSRLALVSRRDNPTFDSALGRIEQLFASQFQMLDLIKRVCDSALEQSALNEPLSNQRAGLLEPQTLITTYDLRRALMEREQELLQLRQSFTFRILQGIRRLSRFGRRAS
jgi:hypothetical protein